MAAPSDEEISRALYFIRFTQTFFCAMYAVVLWDWVVSLPREYKLIWRRKWTVPSFLYIGCRYLILVTMPAILWINSNDSHSAEDCARLYNVPPLISMFYQIFAEAVLLVRTHAFLGRRMSVLVTLCVALFAVGGYQIYVAISQMAPLPFITPPFQSGPCLPTVRYTGSPHITFWFICPLMFDTLVAGMTILQAFRIRVNSGGGADNKILRIFLREGIFYFILISGANIINGVFSALPDPAISAMLVPLSLAFPDIIACRLILDLREQGTSTSAQSQPSSNGIVAARPRPPNPSYIAGSTPLRTLASATNTSPTFSPMGSKAQLADDFDSFDDQSKYDNHLSLPTHHTRNGHLMALPGVRIEVDKTVSRM